MELFKAYLVLFLFGWSCYMTGMAHGDGYFLEFKSKWYIQAIVRTFYFFIESPIKLVVLTFKTIRLPFLRVWIYFQLGFYLTYIFNKKKLIISQEKLQGLNKISQNRRNTNKLKDRIYRHATTLVNNLNNFNPNSCQN